MSSIQPSIDYALSIWSNTTNVNIDKVQRIQNYAARVIINQFDSVNVRGIDIIKTLRWMNVKQRFKYFNILHIFKCIHELAPQYLCNNIIIECEIALRNTRSFDSTNIFIPFENMSQSKNFVSTAGISWNVLPADLKCDTDLNMFKFKLKQLIL